VVKALTQQAGEGVQIVRTGSRGMTWLEPLVEVETPEGRIAYGPVTPADVAGLLAAGLLSGADHPLRIGRPEDHPFMARQTRLTFARCGIVDPLSLDDYRAHGGLEGLTKALAMGPEAVVAEVTASGLRGRGGAGFPTGIKWKTVADAAADRKYIVCNADEGDSGTFADRMVLEGDPFCLIEGMVIAGLAVGATKGFVYSRSEYPHANVTFTDALILAREAGLIGPDVLGSGRSFELELRVGAGAYVCGEETALLESLEGKRGEPRMRPPYIAEVGLFGRPTLEHNFETLFWVRDIIQKGAAWFSGFGRHGRHGLRSFSVSGRVREPGVKLAPAGITARELIDEYEGRKPPSLALFLEYLGITEDEFNAIVAKTVVPPCEPNFSAELAPKTSDFNNWYREPEENRGIRRKIVPIVKG
jgi:formate dehydrogenase iron-sulfur subunit